MKLIKPSYTIETPINGGGILKLIEVAGRTAYKSESKIGTYKRCSDCQYSPDIDCPKETLKKYCCLGRVDMQTKVLGLPSEMEFVSRLIKNKHEAVLELGGMINVRFICDRGVSHEIVRHRIASFVQESTRYCNYANGKDIEFIIPCWLDIKEGIYKNAEDYRNLHIFEIDYLHTLLTCEYNYTNFINRYQWSPQQARSVLPNSLKTEIVVGANIREWRHIFKLRTAKGAHPQMRELMCPLLDEFKSKIPILFDDIIY
jgi:thymidylate synthase (FAD)